MFNESWNKLSTMYDDICTISVRRRNIHNVKQYTYISQVYLSIIIYGKLHGVKPQFNRQYHGHIS